MLRLEVTSTLLFVVSLFVCGLAAMMDNHLDARRAQRAALSFAALSLALLFPLGALGWKDLCLVTGLVLCVAVIRFHEDPVLVITNGGLGAIAFGLWVMLYQMTWTQYGIGFGLALLVPVLLAAVLRMPRPKNDSGSTAPASALAA